MSRMTVEDAARIITALGRNAGNADDWDLGELISLRDVVEQSITVAVAGLRAQGHSWAYIGGGLGVTRQAAQARYAAACDAAS